MYRFYEDSDWLVNYTIGIDHVLSEYARFVMTNKNTNYEYSSTHENSFAVLFSNLHDCLQALSTGRISIKVEECHLSMCVEFDIIVCEVTLAKKLCIIGKRMDASQISKMCSYNFYIVENISDDWNWDAANSLFLTINLDKYGISHCLHTPCVCALFDRHPWLLFAYITFTYGIFVNKIRMRFSKTRKHFKVYGVSINNPNFKNVESIFHMYMKFDQPDKITPKVWFSNSRSAKYIANFE